MIINIFLKKFATTTTCDKSTPLTQTPQPGLMSLKKKAIIFTLVLSGILLTFYQYFFYALLIIPALVFVFFYRKIKKAVYILLYFFKLFLKKHPQVVETGAAVEKYHFIQLANGRKLSYQVFGLPNGWPVFYFHGTPSSSSEAQLFTDEFLINNQIRLIAIDRPGIGMSDFQKNRTFSNWAKDVEEVANNLGIDKFSVLGFSGGGPYVAACTAFIPERLASALIVSGAWQMNAKEAQQHIYERVRLFWKVAAKAPFLLPYILKGMQTEKEEITEEDVENWKHKATEVDFNFLNENNRIGHLKRAIMFALSNIKGTTWDVKMYVRKWDFNPEKISFPITILHGLQDRNVPVALVEKMGAIIPNSTLKLYDNEGHYSILGNQLQDVIYAVTGKAAILPEKFEPIVNDEQVSNPIAN